MALSAGTRLGPYEILAPLGAGRLAACFRTLNGAPLVRLLTEATWSPC